MCKKFYKGKETVLDQSESEVAQSCPTLCDPIDCSLLGSSVHGIFQAIVLEWIAISFSDPGIEPGSPALMEKANQIFWSIQNVYKCMS